MNLPFVKTKNPDTVCCSTNACYSEVRHRQPQWQRFL